MSLSDHVRTLGRGPGRARSLTRDEAQNAMTLILEEGCAPEAIGALLMLMRMKGETAEEIAGFAAAAQASTPALPAVDLDWPSYAAGRTRGVPWFLLSARLIAEAGHRVLLHGWNGQDNAVRAGLADAGIGVARDASDAARLLDRDRIAYMPLEVLHPRLFQLLDLRRVLGLRSCINTVCRMLNPGRAPSSVQGVFHPSYRLLQADAAALLGWHGLSVIKGGGGEFERNPAKDAAAFGLRNAAPWCATYPATRDEVRRLSDASAQSLAAAPPTAFEVDIVTGTAALALDTLGETQAETTARDIWFAHPGFSPRLTGERA
ncbi:glycosyl transferase family protein [Cognatishimia sp. F0-27]|uniref:glycosyl transferase family protein n=1 Tax=Cognatishimia sp. F0-27 TaxID=2816855 RepID=UPI001D0C0470|nr:glycosyl transferase family protein [Cognatishimia sp. F0-27]MCC1492162.1 glycosyl transferase family protein [Cognatishimia sp. F0-27]